MELERMLSLIRRVMVGGVLGALWLPAGLCRGEGSWPGFRGPQGNGHAAAEAQVPIEFGPDSGLRWQQAIPGSGDVTETHVRWRMPKQAPTKPSPLALDGRIYTISDGGVFCCTDASSGQLLYQKRVSGKYSASPLLAGGHIYLGNHEGVITVVRTAQSLYRFTARD